MKKVISILLLAIIPQVFAVTYLPKSHKLSKEQKIQNFIKKLESEEDKIQGGAIAILDKGHIVYKKTFGYQKARSNSPITSRTLFPLASVSKAVSASAVALMVQKGTLNLEEKFSFPYLQNPVSVKNLLSHTTGYRFSGNQEIEHGFNRSKLLKTLEAQSPACSPGSCYSYSNTTFSLIEEALNSKNSNLDLAIKNLRNTLKTDGIQVDPLDSDADVAYPHAIRSSKRGFFYKLLPFPRYYPVTVPAAAGVFASLDGMIEVYKFNFGYRPDLISKKTLDIFHTPVAKNYDLRTWKINWPFPKKYLRSYYGLGWRIIEADNKPNKGLVFHSGHISGVRSFIGFVPSEDIGLIFLTNQDSDFPVKKGFDFWGMFL